jgi:hypothetical protein
MPMPEVGSGGGVTTASRPFTSRPSRDLKVVIGGWLTIIAGVLVISNGLGGLWPLNDAVEWLTYACAALVITMGVIGVIGGICALKDVRMSISLAGAFLAAFGDGLPSFFLGVTALLLFFTSNRDL